MKDRFVKYGWVPAPVLIVMFVLGLFNKEPEGANVISASVFNVYQSSAEDTFKTAGQKVLPPQRVSPVPLPENLSFAGEPVPLSIRDVRERMDRELLVNTFYHSNTIFMLKKANKYFPEIERVLRENGVPDDFKYLAIAESGLQNVTSPAGAKGFWQFMETTAESYGLEVRSEVDERYDYVKSAQAACEYLKEAKEMFGSWTLAAASYNMGMGRLSQRLEEQGVDSYYDLYLNSETARYVYRIIAYKLLFQDPSAFGFHLAPGDLYEPYEYKKVWVEESIPDLAQFALDQGTNYKMLKVLNPWLRDDKLTILSGSDGYMLKIALETEVVDEEVEEEGSADQEAVPAEEVESN